MYNLSQSAHSFVQFLKVCANFEFIHSIPFIQETSSFMPFIQCARHKCNHQIIYTLFSKLHHGISFNNIKYTCRISKTAVLAQLANANHKYYKCSRPNIAVMCVYACLYLYTVVQISWFSGFEKVRFNSTGCK